MLVLVFGDLCCPVALPTSRHVCAVCAGGYHHLLPRIHAAGHCGDRVAVHGPRAALRALLGQHAECAARSTPCCLTPATLITASKREVAAAVAHWQDCVRAGVLAGVVVYTAADIHFTVLGCASAPLLQLQARVHPSTCSRRTMTRQVHVGCGLVRVRRVRDGLREARGGQRADDHLVTHLLPGLPHGQPCLGAPTRWEAPVHGASDPGVCGSNNDPCHALVPHS